MRLLKCHIENFGKLTNFNFEFDKELNVLNHENGWGKTTFATFIKSMFYGLATTTKRNLDENERKKYKPWQGGNFGGNIEFETNQKSYRITRFFGKNSSEDTFELVDLVTGKKSSDYSEKIGEELFALDSDAFERSAFIPQKSFLSLINESISNKLTNLIHGTTEQFNLEGALEILDKKRADLSNNKKTGLIQVLENDVEDLVFQINSLKSNGQAIEQIQLQIDEEENEIEKFSEKQKSLQEKMNDVAKIKEKVANKDLHKKYTDTISDINKKIEHIDEILNGHITSTEEVNEYLNLVKDCNKKQEKIELLQDDYVANRYQELSDYFGEDNLPNEEEFDIVQQKINQYNALKLRNHQTEPNQDKIKKNKNLLSIVMLILCALFIVGGIATLKFEILPIILFVTGGLTFILAGFFYLKNLINNKDSADLNKEIDSKKILIEMTNLENDIKQFNGKYNELSANMTEDFSKIYSNFKEFQKISVKNEKNKENMQQLMEEIENCNKNVEEFLLKFNLKNMSNFDSSDKLELIKKSIIDRANLKEKSKKEEEEFDKFKKEKHFDLSDEEFDDVDLSDLQVENESLQRIIDGHKEKKAKFLARIDKLNEELSKIDDFENQKEELEKKIEVLSQELSAVKNAKKFLEEASDSLSAKLLSPMKDGLRKYLKMMTGTDFANLQLDTDFVVTFDEYGKSREIDYLSKGYKDTIELCMRLALIESLFDKEKPFVVVDDAFVNMDEIKIENGKKFLKELSKNFQVIYFVCHNSRI